jgi:hypothetical protein
VPRAGPGRNAAARSRWAWFDLPAPIASEEGSARAEARGKQSWLDVPAPIASEVCDEQAEARGNRVRGGCARVDA